MRLAYSVGTTSFGSFTGVSLQLNGFSEAPTNDVSKNKARNARSGTRMSSAKQRVFVFTFATVISVAAAVSAAISYMQAARLPLQGTNFTAPPAPIVPHPPAGL